MIEKSRISIFGIEQKKSQGGKSYWIVDTSDGKMSIWDIGLYELIKEKAVGNLCEVGVETTKSENGKTYKNIKTLEAVLGNAAVKESKSDNIGESARLRRRTDCLISAKDLVIAKIIPMDKLLDIATSFVLWVEPETEEKLRVETIKA